MIFQFQIQHPATSRDGDLRVKCCAANQSCLSNEDVVSKSGGEQSAMRYAVEVSTDVCVGSA